AYVVQSLLHLIATNKLNLQDIRITVLGITFKENIPDIRNSKSIEIVEQLQQLGMSVQVCDPQVSQEQLGKNNNIKLTKRNQFKKSDIVILTVPHKKFNTQDSSFWSSLLKGKQGIIMDLKGVIPRDILPEYITLWKL